MTEYHVAVALWVVFIADTERYDRSLPHTLNEKGEALLTNIDGHRSSEKYSQALRHHMIRKAQTLKVGGLMPAAKKPCRLWHCCRVSANPNPCAMIILSPSKPFEPKPSVGQTVSTMARPRASLKNGSCGSLGGLTAALR